MNTQSIREMLVANPPFADIGADVVDAFLEAGKDIRLGPDEVILLEQSVNEKVYLILDGTVHCSAEWARVERTAELPAGTLFGLEAFVSDQESISSLTFIAATDVHLLVWDAKDWQRLCAEHPAAGYKITRYVAQQFLRWIREWLMLELNALSWGIE